VPQPLAPEGVGTDELVTKDALDDVGDNSGTAAVHCEGNAVDTLVGPQPQYGDVAGTGPAPKSLPPRKRGMCTGSEHIEAVDVGDAQTAP